MRVKIYTVVSFILGAIIGLFSSPFIIWHLLKLEWINSGFLQYIFSNPIFWLLFIGFSFRYIVYLFLKKKCNLKPTRIISVAIILTLLIIVSLITYGPARLLIWGSGTPFDISFETVVRESEPVGLLKEKGIEKSYLLRSEYKFVDFAVGDSPKVRPIYSKFCLEENTLNKTHIVKRWKFNTGLLGKLFLSRDTNTLVMVLFGHNETRIFKIDTTSYGIKEIKDFFGALENRNEDEMTRKYALYALGVEFLPRTRFMQLNGYEENDINSFVTKLGKLATPAALQLINEKIESNELWDDLRMSDIYWEEGIHNISDGAAVILAHLGVEEAIIPILENQAAFSSINLTWLERVMEIFGDKAIPYLTSALQHKDPKVRRFARGILIHLGVKVD